jgi:hypothetical protein
MLCAGAGLLTLSLVLPDTVPFLQHVLAPGSAHAETQADQAARERLEAQRVERFREKQWDEFLKVLKTGDSKALKHWLRLPITAEVKLNTERDFVTVVASPRILRGVNRAKFTAMDTGFVVEWTGDGSLKFMRYQLTFTKTDSDDTHFVVTGWNKWQQNY